MYQRFLLSGARKARNAFGLARCAWAPKNCSLPAAWAARSFASISPRNRSDRTRLGRKNLGLAVTQREPSMGHGRAPGVQHRGEADAGAEMLGVGCDRAFAVAQDPVKLGLV